ncbi:MAG: Cu(I)-responsive transcriptional regulator [Endozoicomonas sp.]
MNISEASRKSGLTSKTVRYYESIGLIEPASRSANGYRTYGDSQLRELGFVHHARELGFTLDECRELLNLYRDRSRKSGSVKAMAMDKINDIQTRIDKLETMKQSLSELASCCAGDDRPDCPILDSLAK